jgi:hypothetical protein
MIFFYFMRNLRTAVLNRPNGGDETRSYTCHIMASKSSVGTLNWMYPR